MSIPKTIHYCWFGRNPKSEMIRKCIDSWKKFCSDYEIIEWNEDNFSFDDCVYAREAYDNKGWAFVSDYARLKIIFEHGGVYLDTDVELLKNIDELLENRMFMGFQSTDTICTGLGFGAEAGHELVKAMLDDYSDIHFIDENGKKDMLPCPDRNAHVLGDYGFISNNTRQSINGVEAFPTEYFCPLDSRTGKLNITDKSYSIHWFNASWYDLNKKIERQIKWKLGVRFYVAVYLRAKRWAARIGRVFGY